MRRFLKKDSVKITGAIVAGVVVGGVAMWYLREKQNLLVSMKIIDQMKLSGNGILAVEPIPGYDALVKLIPVQK